MKKVIYILLFSNLIFANNIVFKKYSCDSCHAFGNSKGMASNLKDIGKNRDVVYLRNYILNPKSSVMPSFKQISEKELEELLVFLGANFTKEYYRLSKQRLYGQRKAKIKHTQEQLKLHRECNSGVCNSCEVLAYMYDFGFNVVKNKQKAQKLYKQGCK